MPENSLDKILQAVKEDQQKYASNYWVPSTQDPVRLTEINTAQQKKLIKSVIDSPVFNTEFIYTFKEILEENVVGDTNINNLTVLDKLVLAIALRATCIGPTIDIEVTPENSDKSVSHTIDLIELYNKVKAGVEHITEEKYEIGNYRVVCSIPTIETEFRAEKELRQDSEKIELNSNKELRDTLGEAFISEIVKYIKNVEVKIQENFEDIQWNTLSFSDRIRVLETFNMKLLNSVIEYINKVKKEVDKVELINFKVGDKKYERRLTIDGNFFTIS